MILKNSIFFGMDFSTQVLQKNLFIQGLSGKTNIFVRDECIKANNSHANVFPNNTDLVNADIYNGGVFLGCLFGPAAMYIW